MHTVKKNSVLIVDDDKANIIVLTHVLTPEYIVYAAKNGPEAIEAAKEHLPDVVLLDIIMPGMNGFEVLSLLRSDEKTEAIPVIFVTGLGEIENEEKGLALGAADYISKPFSPSIVKLRVRNQIQILNQIEMIRYLSITDQLTDVSNRRNFDYRLRLDWDHAKRDKKPLSVLMIDIDNFKEYNDDYGHLQGDAALQTTAKCIKKSLSRSIDFVARWGGEEFIVLLPCTDLPGALKVAELIRENVEKAAVFYGGNEITKITISIGVNTHATEDTDSIDDFINGVDKALYNAKKTGKNKVCAYKK